MKNYERRLWYLDIIRSAKQFMEHSQIKFLTDTPLYKKYVTWKISHVSSHYHVRTVPVMTKVKLQTKLNSVLLFDRPLLPYVTFAVHCIPLIVLTGQRKYSWARGHFQCNRESHPRRFVRLNTAASFGYIFISPEHFQFHNEWFTAFDFYRIVNSI